MKTLYSSSAFGQMNADTLTAFFDLDENALGKTPELVATSFKRLTGLFNPDEGYAPIKIEEYHDACLEFNSRIFDLDPSGRASLQFICYLSGYFHEIRHAHDLISTRYGQDLLHSRFSLYQNFPAILGIVSAHDCFQTDGRINLPVTTNYSQFLNEDSKSIISISEKLMSFKKSLSSYNAPALSSNAQFTVHHLLEASAIITQLGFVKDTFGVSWASKILDLMRQDRSSNIYLRLISNFNSQLLAKGMHEENIGSVHQQVIWYALNGSTSIGSSFQEGVSGVVLYEAILQRLLSLKTFPKDPGTQQAWLNGVVCELYESWGLMSPSDVTVKGSRVCERRIEGLENELRRHNLDVNSRSGTSAYIHFMRSYEAMNNFIKEPAANYFSEYGYTALVLLAQYPSIVVKVKHNRKFEDFVSFGTENINFDDMNDLTYLSVLFDVLMNGRSQSTSTQLEDFYFDLLATSVWNNKKMSFKDSSELFDW